MFKKNVHIIYISTLLLTCSIVAVQKKSADLVLSTQNKKETEVATKKRAQRPKKQISKIESQSAAKMAEAAAAPEKKRKGRRGRRLAKKTPKVARKTLSTMNLQELKKSKEALVEAGNKEVAIKYLEKMIPLCTDMHYLAEIMIELADMYYDTERKAKAFTMYREFVNLYPGSDHVEYALYRATVCKFDEIGDADRDQSQTKETIELAEEFLERSELFVTHKDEVFSMLKKCRERLFENELSIFNFYLFNNRMAAANKRLDSIKNEYVSLLPEKEPRIVMLEIEFAQAQNNNERVEQKQEELITKFPTYVIQSAQNIPKKKSVMDRF